MRAIPDTGLSLAAGAVKPFQTKNGLECQRDLLKAAAAKGVSVKIPFAKLPAAHKEWVLLGEAPERPGDELWNEGLWYGVRGFFNWLESKSYKMHVRVLLSRYRTYSVCPDCAGGRFAPETLLFRWDGLTAPDLKRLPVDAMSHWQFEIPDLG
jgi:excinuclease ABC subunit A